MLWGIMSSLQHSLLVFQILDAQRRLKGNLDDGIAVTESVTALLATKDQLPQLGTDAVSRKSLASVDLVFHSLNLSPLCLSLSLSLSLSHFLPGIDGLEADQDR